MHLNKCSEYLVVFLNVAVSKQDVRTEWWFLCTAATLVTVRFVFGSAEAASRAIVQFLEVNQSEEASRGWMLLTTINLLASSGQVGRETFHVDLLQVNSSLSKNHRFSTN